MSALDLIHDPIIRADYESRITGLYRKAYATQGRKSLESTRHCAAIHEAGHAVVYVATADRVRWWPPYRLRIWRELVSDLSVWLGKTEVSPKAPPIRVMATELEASLVYAIRLAAGVMAERLLDGHDFRLASSADELVMVGSVARNLEEHHWHQSAEHCMALVLAVTVRILRAHAPTLETLAATLEQQRKIQGAELHRQLRGIEPIALPLDFDALMQWTP